MSEQDYLPHKYSAEQGLLHTFEITDTKQSSLLTERIAALFSAGFMYVCLVFFVLITIVPEPLPYPPSYFVKKNTSAPIRFTKPPARMQVPLLLPKWSPNNRAAPDHRPPPPALPAATGASNKTTTPSKEKAEKSPAAQEENSDNSVTLPDVPELDTQKTNLVIHQENQPTDADEPKAYTPEPGVNPERTIVHRSTNRLPLPDDAVETQSVHQQSFDTKAFGAQFMQDMKQYAHAQRRHNGSRPGTSNGNVSGSGSGTTDTANQRPTVKEQTARVVAELFRDGVGRSLYMASRNNRLNVHNESISAHNISMLVTINRQRKIVALRMDEPSPFPYINDYLKRLLFNTVLPQIPAEIDAETFTFPISVLVNPIYNTREIFLVPA